MTEALEIANAVILALTLLLTLKLAQATTAHAAAAQRHVNLVAAVDARPLLSVSKLRCSWDKGSLNTVQFTVSNAGKGSCFNLAVNIRGIAGEWQIQWTTVESEDETAYGAIREGDERKFIASASGVKSTSESFQNELVVTIECFDVLLAHYIFRHSFLVRDNIPYALDSGVKMEIDS